MYSSLFTLDTRAISQTPIHAQIFQIFDALSPGEAFVLVSDSDLKPVLREFQIRRAREFEWNVLEAGPQNYRVEVCKRISAEPRDISSYLEYDHTRLDLLLKEVGKKVLAGNFPAALRKFSEFACGLSTHIDREEQILFPVFEKATNSGTGGPTRLMRIEHNRIRKALLSAGKALRAMNEQAYLTARAAIVEIRDLHNIAEENILYPACDRTAGGNDEREELVRRMQLL